VKKGERERNRPLGTKRVAKRTREMLIDVKKKRNELTEQAELLTGGSA
jgi:hypothetical protein